MKRSIIMKGAYLAMAVISSVAVLAGCNKKLTVKFDYNASDYVKLNQYKGIEAHVDVDAIQNEILQDRIQSDLDKVTTYTEISRASEEGDQLTLSFIGSIGGSEVEGFSSDSYSLVLGKDSFNIPGFVDELYGLKAGDTKVMVLTVPETFQDEPEYAGKRIVYDVSVLKVEAPVAPQITDSYAKQYYNYDTVEEYKAGLLNELQSSIDEEVTTQKKNAVLEALQQCAEVISYPEDLLTSKKESLDKSMLLYSTMYNMTTEEYCQSRYGISYDEYIKRAVVQDLIIQEIIEKENLTIDEYYYKGNLDAFAKEQGYTSADTFVEKFGKDLVVRNMLVEKAQNLVIENAVYD